MGLALRHRTTICQKLPKDFEQKLLNYQRYITNLRKMGNFLMGQIANVDETAIYLDMPPNYMLEKKGVKEILLKTTGCEKLRLTVMLAATADGKKLPPFLILKRKTVPKSESFPKDVIVRAQEKGWMTEELMLKCWISNALDGSEDDILWKDDVEEKDDSDWVESTDNDSVMSDDGESGMEF
jgi:hypothetical protein